MTDAQPQDTPRTTQPDPPNSPDDASGTDADPTDTVDKIKCDIEAVKAQADINAQNQQALSDANTKFASVRLEYITTRTQNDDTIKQLGDQVKTLITRIRCKFTDKDIAPRLEAAYRQVVTKIEKYQPQPPPNSQDEPAADTKAQKEEKDVEDLSNTTDLHTVRTIRQRLQGEMTTALERFEFLANEPAALSERIAKCKDDIAAAEKGAESTDDNELAESFAQALVAQYHCTKLVGDYATSLQFSTAFGQELAKLTTVSNNLGVAVGVERRLACIDSAASIRYHELTGTMVSEVLAAYQFGLDTPPPANARNTSA